jgi:plasmid stabilization system protein ParE
VKLVWSCFAIEDRFAIFDYIEQDNPRVVLAVDERIQNSAELLANFQRCTAMEEWREHAN